MYETNIYIYFRTLGVTEAATEFANSVSKKKKNKHKSPIQSVNQLSTYV